MRARSPEWFGPRCHPSARKVESILIGRQQGAGRGSFLIKARAQALESMLSSACPEWAPARQARQANEASTT
jgi:hypothetical protein